MNLLFKKEPYVYPSIKGLSYISDFITEKEEQALKEAIDHQPWLNDLKRRVQHYGYQYDYKARRVHSDSYLGALPNWLSIYQNRLVEQGIFSNKPDQAIVNEYMPGQGIAAHVDCVPCFDGTIASLTLESGATMQFKNITSGEKQEIYLEPRSLIVLSGPARYEWQHAIPARQNDVWNSVKIPRNRRISVTFRNVIVE